MSISELTPAEIDALKLQYEGYVMDCLVCGIRSIMDFSEYLAECDA